MGSVLSWEETVIPFQVWSPHGVRRSWTLVPALLAFVVMVSAGAARADQPASPDGQGSTPSARTEDVSTINGVVNALYESVSAGADQTREWSRYLSLFKPDARQVVVHAPAAGQSPVFSAFTAAEFVKQAQGQKPIAMFEREIRRRVDEVGQIALVTSVHEVRWSADGPADHLAVYGLQLAHDGRRWWIVNVLWQSEGAGVTVPAAFLANAP